MDSIRQDKQALDITRPHRFYLLNLARQAIAHFAREDRLMDGPGPKDPALLENRGAFVTLHSNGDLRGCVGVTEPIKPLWRAVADSAVGAAFGDSRFPSLSLPELPALEIVVSCLSVPVPIGGLDEVVLGRDGLILEKGSAKAVFLPCVAVEQEWDLETTLSHLAVKAGLAPSAWKSDCRISIFQATVFSDKDLSAS